MGLGRVGPTKVPIKRPEEILANRFFAEWSVRPFERVLKAARVSTETYMEIDSMNEALEPTQDAGWILSHEGYDVSGESALEWLPRIWQWIPGHARCPVRQPRSDLGGLARI